MQAGAEVLERLPALQPFPELSILPFPFQMVIKEPHEACISLVALVSLEPL